MIDDGGLLLRQTEAARRLGISARTLEKWRVNGRGPRFVRLGRAVAYDPADLEEFIETGRRRSTSDPGQRTKAPTPLPTKPEGRTPGEIGEWAAKTAIAEVEAKRWRRAA